ncbi:MAG: alpha-galactosidase [Planctomycetia bacterium]|nr:alpha-galactosidase [Planctomycetia bacterium]
MKLKCVIAVLVLLAPLSCALAPSTLQAQSPAPPRFTQNGAPLPPELTFMQQWREFLLGKAPVATDRYSADVPFSFMVGERSSRDWVKVDNAKITSQKCLENGERLTVLTWRDDATGLVCETTLAEYRDFPAMQWTVRLRNDASENSAPVHDFKALDLQWNRADTGLPLLYRTQGSDGREDDFLFAPEEMRKSMWVHNRDVRMDSAANSAFRVGLNSSLFDSDMRPSATWLPFFNYQTGPDGLIVALGWNGGWFAQFNHDGDGHTQITAGQERLNTVLYPGETIRSPLVGIMYWQGDVVHAQNMFRRYMLAHNHPQENGKPALPPICRNSWGGTPTAEHLQAIAQIAQMKFDYDCYWIDAGWYGSGTEPCPSVFQGDWGSTVGDWRVNPTRHPDTLKPIADALQALNMKFLLWFETERAVQGVPATLEHPDWYLTSNGAPAAPGQSLLLNLGCPEAREQLTQTIADILEENHVSWYREDFNMIPNPYWEAHDAPDRIGMTEMRFVEGLYQFWDDLRARIPGLMIDNCASGGRRLELETLKRSIVLWRTDYNCFPYLRTEATQSHGFGLARWIPANATSPFVTDIDDYKCRSALSSGAVLALEASGQRVSENANQWLRDRVAEAKRCRPYYYGDFYPLTEGNHANDAWLAYSMFLPEEDAGIVVAFRRPNSPVAALIVELPTIEPGKVYEFEDADSQEKTIIDGKELIANGFMIKTSEPRQSKLIYYRAVK